MGKQEIQKAINGFETNNFSDASIALLKSIGLQSSKRIPMDAKNYAEFESLFCQASKPFDKAKALVSDWLYIDFLFQITDDELKLNFKKSEVNTTADSYLFFCIELKNNEYSRTALSQITREINKQFSIPALIIFKTGNTLTLSIINRRLHKRDDTKDVLEKITLIKDINIIVTHRAHIEILNDLSIEQLKANHAINNFIDLHNAWRAVLDTKELNNKFYRELSEWYFWAMGEVFFPDPHVENIQINKGKLENEKVREINAKHLIRLLTRILFVWFIKEKKLVPGELFDIRHINVLLKKFDPMSNESSYYKSVLQNLFFATLNQEIESRSFRNKDQHYGISNLYRYQDSFTDSEKFKELLQSVPFLNGGLFECLDYFDENLKTKRGSEVRILIDGFSDRDDNPLSVPNYLFFAESAVADLSKELDDNKKKNAPVRGLFTILNNYKFTIAENTPIEEDVALDPELLGNVFENLLASYNPETKSTARKATGSYYTPKEIVNYMVDESIKLYLKQALLEKTSSAEVDIETGLDILFMYTEKDHCFNKNETKILIEAIDSCKILDPACGSGAFPMGALQKLVYVLNKLDPGNDLWLSKQLDELTEIKDDYERNEKKKDILLAFRNNEHDYPRKLYLIEKCIYGVDIQSIATQISKLRFFISLMVDQKVDFADKVGNFRVRPLPNLETKFVTANTLVGISGSDQMSVGNLILGDLEIERDKIRHKIFGAKTPKTKRLYRDKFIELQEKIKEKLIKANYPATTADILSKWNPFDQNASSPFFDPAWMFGIKDGFDIVIGNPPYIKELGNKEIFNPIINTEWGSKWHNGKMDYWYFFAHKGFEILKPLGSLCFIASNYFPLGEGGKKLNEYIISKCNLLTYIDFNKIMIFESADVQTMIMLVCNSYTGKGCNAYRFHNIDRDLIGNELHRLKESKVVDYNIILDTNSILNNDGKLIFSSDKHSALLKKLDSFKVNGLYKTTQGIAENPNCISNKTYKALVDKGITGIYPGDEVFVIKKKNIDKYRFNDDEKVFLREYHYPSEIHAYFCDAHYEYLLLYLTNQNIQNISLYPNIKKHLIKYKVVMDQRRETIHGSNKWFHLHWPRKESVFLSEKIVYPQMCDAPCFAYINKPYFINMSANLILKTNPQFNLKNFTAVLNSKLAKFWLNKKGKKRGVNLDISVALVDSFPINMQIINNSLLSEYSKKIIDNAYMGVPIKDLQEAIDKIIYGIYNLTPEEIAIVEG